MYRYADLTLSWLGHDCFRLEKGPLSIYFDPFRLSDAAVKPASLVLITHEHFDHCSVEDLRKVVTPRTIVVAPHECASALSKVEPAEVLFLKPGEERDVLGLHVRAVPAYNTNKFRDPATKTPYHPQEDGKLGYLVTLGDTSVYHAGDTDLIEEMRSFECEVALLPVSGTYVMTAEEAAEAAKLLKPKVAIPMHYGAIVGSAADAERFKRLLDGTGIEVKVLEKE